MARTDSDATADCSSSPIRWGGCRSATSCQTSRGMETISTFPGGSSAAATGEGVMPSAAARIEAATSAPAHRPRALR